MNTKDEQGHEVWVEKDRYILQSPKPPTQLTIYCIHIPTYYRLHLTASKRQPGKHFERTADYKGVPDYSARQKAFLESTGSNGQMALL